MWVFSCPHWPGTRKCFTPGRSHPPNKDSYTSLEIVALLCCFGNLLSQVGKLVKLLLGVQSSVVLVFTHNLYLILLTPTELIL